MCKLLLFRFLKKLFDLRNRFWLQRYSKGTSRGLDNKQKH